MIERRSFLLGSAAFAGMFSFGGCATAQSSGGKMLFGACRGIGDAALLKSVGYDFFENGAANILKPELDEEGWKRQRDLILSAPIPLRSCNGFIPGTFRITGPKRDFDPALAYAEKILRRAEEVGVSTIVFGSGGARNVPGDICGPKEQKPDTEAGRDEFAEFCAKLAARVSDLKKVRVVIEPLRPLESNIINFVWQGQQVCEQVKSPRICLLADIFHMMMGRESAESIARAGRFIKHCHIASWKTRQFPGSGPDDFERFRPYFDALRSIGATGGINCECGWGEKKDFAKNLEKALVMLKSL